MTVFWKDAAERAAKTLVQGVLAFLVGDVTVLSVDWGTALAVSGTAALVSVLSSVLSYSWANNGTASLVREVTVGRHAAPE